MKVGNKVLNSNMVPTWLAVALTAFLILGPIGLILAVTRDMDWRDYWIPAILGAILLVVATYALRNVRRVEASLRDQHNLLRVLIDNLPDRIYIKDAQGRKILANQADWNASGKTQMEDFIGKTDLEIFPPELAERYWADDQLVLQTGQPILNREEPALDAHGKSSVWTLATKVPLHDSDGKLIGLVGISRDISAFKQVAATVRWSQISEAGYFIAPPMGGRHDRGCRNALICSS